MQNSTYKGSAVGQDESTFVRVDREDGKRASEHRVLVLFSDEFPQIKKWKVGDIVNLYYDEISYLRAMVVVSKRKEICGVPGYYSPNNFYYVVLKISAEEMFK